MNLGLRQLDFAWVYLLHPTTYLNIDSLLYPVNLQGSSSMSSKHCF